MKKITYTVVIDSISAVHGEYPGCVDVSFHHEGGDLVHGERDGHQSDRRIALSEKIINADGSYDQQQIGAEVTRAVGTTVTFELAPQKN